MRLSSLCLTLTVLAGCSAGADQVVTAAPTSSASTGATTASTTTASTTTTPNDTIVPTPTSIAIDRDLPAVAGALVNIIEVDGSAPADERLLPPVVVVDGGEVIVSGIGFGPGTHIVGICAEPLVIDAAIGDPTACGPIAGLDIVAPGADGRFETQVVLSSQVQLISGDSPSCEQIDCALVVADGGFFLTIIVPLIFEP